MSTLPLISPVFFLLFSFLSFSFLTLSVPRAYFSPPYPPLHSFSLLIFPNRSPPASRRRESRNRFALAPGHPRRSGGPATPRPVALCVALGCPAALCSSTQRPRAAPHLAAPRSSARSSDEPHPDGRPGDCARGRPPRMRLPEVGGRLNLHALGADGSREKLHFLAPPDTLRL